MKVEFCKGWTYLFDSIREKLTYQKVHISGILHCKHLLDKLGMVCIPIKVGLVILQYSLTPSRERWIWKPGYCQYILSFFWPVWWGVYKVHDSFPIISTFLICFVTWCVFCRKHMDHKQHDTNHIYTRVCHCDNYNFIVKIQLLWIAL